MLPILSWYIGGVDHIHHLDLRREGFLVCTVRPAGLLIILASGGFARVFGCELVSLFYHPKITVGVVGGLFGGAIDLAGPVQDCVQLGWAILVAFRRLFP